MCKQSILEVDGNKTVDKEKLKNLIHELNLDESVDLIPGDKVDVSEKYDEADYMIFPSIYEGFGIVLLEAQ